MFEFIGELLYAIFVGWFWVLAAIFFASLSLVALIAAGSDSSNDDTANTYIIRTAVIGGILLIGVAAYGAYFHLDSYYRVNDLRLQFETSVVTTDATGKPTMNINQKALVDERNRRLGALGRCTAGAWWETKDTGEPPKYNNNAVYYFCNRYITNY